MNKMDGKRQIEKRVKYWIKLIKIQIIRAMSRDNKKNSLIEQIQQSINNRDINKKGSSSRKNINLEHLKSNLTIQHELEKQRQKHQGSNLQTNTNANSNNSRNNGSNLSLKSPTNKRIKTQNKSNQFSNSHQFNKKNIVTKRLKTDVSQRIQSPALVQQRFQDDHYNAVSLAELLQFHTGYNQMDEAQFNFRVRKETQGSRMDEKVQEQKKQRNSQSERQDSQVKVNFDDQNENQEQNEENIEDKQLNDKNEIVQSNITKKSDKNTLSVKPYQDSKSQKDSNFVSHYTLGATLGVLSQIQDKKKKNIIKVLEKKPPKIRTYSLEQKIKIIQSNKYTPRTQEEIRMEARYLKSQINALNLYKQTEQMISYLSQYQNNKKSVLQQAARKYQINKMMQNIKKQNKISELNPQTGLKKSFSLPKIKTLQQFILPQPEQVQRMKQKDDRQIYLDRYNQKLQKIGQSLSVTRLHYSLKKEKCQQEIRRTKQMDNNGLRIQTQNIEHIENVLRSKGVQFDVNTIRKGLITLRTIPNIEKSSKLQLPRNLISNPKYKKYPL